MSETIETVNFEPEKKTLHVMAGYCIDRLRNDYQF